MGKLVVIVTSGLFACGEWMLLYDELDHKSSELAMWQVEWIKRVNYNLLLYMSVSLLIDVFINY